MGRARKMGNGWQSGKNNNFAYPNILEIKKMIAIVNYNMGNLESVANMLKKAGQKSAIVSDAGEIARAEKLILPGVGAFDAGMENLKKLDLIGALNKRIIEDKIPVLGICLGMQLMTEKSEEGALPGLCYLRAETARFRFPPDSGLKIPHMGWNTIAVKKESRLLAGIGERARFYFVHSYYVACRDKNDILAATGHGGEFVSAVERGNIFGVQFHPEKSLRYGLQVLKNFAELI